jgi:hypothetical protein
LESLLLLTGHLIGDFIWQNDWMAANKTNPHPGPEPHPGRIWLGADPAPIRPYPGPWSVDVDPVNRDAFAAALEERNKKIREWNEAENTRVTVPDEALAAQRAWWFRRRVYRVGHLACTVHCLLYTLAVLTFCYRFLPWWAYPVIFLTHWPIDRYRLARVVMERYIGQKQFANGPLSPWSVIVVDQVLHVWILAVLGTAVVSLGGAP